VEREFSSDIKGGKINMAITKEKIKEIPFGLADFIFNEGEDDEVKFDGADQLQADGGSVSITANYEDITSPDFGTSPISRRLVGYEIEVTVVAAQRNMKTMQLQMGHASTITETTGGAVVGLMDSPIGSDVLDNAKSLRIHPREKGTDQSFDIVIYRVASNGEYSNNFALEQGQQEMTFTAYPREGADAKKPGNFFYIGGVDPNAAA
jgi:hypothetical protein